MSDPFLILHKVRGEPAFDIATKIDCPICFGGIEPEFQCDDCNGEGSWWIIPTSGHRAHPYWYIKLPCSVDKSDVVIGYTIWSIPSMPPNWPDHYPSRAAPSIDIRSVISALAPKMEIDRRF